MKCYVIKNAKGEVVAAYPLSAHEGPHFEIQLEKGETVCEMDVSQNAMCDSKSFLESCTS